MRKWFLAGLFGLLGLAIQAQPLSYYESIQNLNGTALKAALHEVINEHQEFQYSTVKQILRDSDEDPANDDNIILFYTGWSIPKANFASSIDSLDYWNREHVWAKSHGDFGTDPGAGTDAHALRPVDNSVNNARSYKDFDEGGNEYYDNGIPTGCYSTTSTWEPRDEVKGDVARTILYMDVRYEGTNGELDLTAVDQINTFPLPQHGKLSTLLQWHQQDPPDAFERRRNDVIHRWQKNRNPFIDYPELVDLIWNNATVNPIQFNPAQLNPTEPQPLDPVMVTADIIPSSGLIQSADLYWGTSYYDMSQVIPMVSVGSSWQAEIPGQDANERVYMMIVASNGTDTNYYRAWYDVANYPFSGTITPIQQVQGQAASSPMVGQNVSVAGIVTGAFGADFFLQEGDGPWSGVYVYNSGYFPNMGDSLIVTGEVIEYYGKTEITSVSDVFFISSNNPLPDPVILQTGATEDEQWESVFVKVINAQCVRDTAFGMWIVNDGTGDALIHNSAIYSYPYVIGEYYDIMGVLNYDFDQFKIELRGPDDVEAGTDEEPPFILNVEPLSANLIYVYFNEDLEAASSSTLANYAIDNGVVITSAAQHAFDKKRVILGVENLNGGDYTLTVQNLSDLSGNMLTEGSFSFSYLNASEVDELPARIYPNPGNGLFQIDLSSVPGIVQIQLYNAQGQLVYSRVANGQELHSMDIQAESAGVYFLRLEQSEGLFQRVLVKE